MQDDLQPVANPLPDPPKNEGSGIAGFVNMVKGKSSVVIDKAKVSASIGYDKAKTGVVEGYNKLQENEKIKRATDKTIEVAGQAQEFGQRKITELKESEKVQKALETSGAAISTVKEKTAQAIEKTKETKDRTKAKTKEIWTRGRGKIRKIRNEIGLTWGSSAQEILLKREEAAKKWQDIKIRGAEDITIGARKEFTTAYFVEKGTLMRWSFRVKDYDVGFGVRIRVMQDGGSIEEDVLPVERFDNVDTIEGSWVADEDRTMVLVFDNTYSKLRSKTVAYLVGTVPANKLTAEDLAECGAEVSEEGGVEFSQEGGGEGNN